MANELVERLTQDLREADENSALLRGWEPVAERLLERGWVEQSAHAAMTAERDALREALQEIADSGHCGCRPCYGHPERDAYIDIARAALAAVKKDGSA